jgi:hypothetical protein
MLLPKIDLDFSDAKENPDEAIMTLSRHLPELYMCKSFGLSDKETLAIVSLALYQIRQAFDAYAANAVTPLYLTKEDARKFSLIQPLKERLNRKEGNQSELYRAAKKMCENMADCESGALDALRAAVKDCG